MADSSARQSPDPGGDNLCPITLKPIPADPLDVAYVYASASPFSEGAEARCGHRCSLIPLVRYIQDGKPSDQPTSAVRTGGSSSGRRAGGSSGPGGVLCPVCGESSVVSVVDGAARSALLAAGVSQENAAKGRLDHDVIAFKHGKQTFWLAVPRSDGGSGLWRRAPTAQERIGHVLGIDAGRGLKVLHKGKVTYPASSGTPVELSERLLGVSKADFDQRRKPSLVVMGSRPQDVTATPGDGSWKGGIFNLFYWGVAGVFRMFTNILGGVILFAKSLFVLPSTERRDE